MPCEGDVGEGPTSGGGSGGCPVRVMLARALLVVRLLEGNEVMVIY